METDALSLILGDKLREESVFVLLVELYSSLFDH